MVVKPDIARVALQLASTNSRLCFTEECSANRHCSGLKCIGRERVRHRRAQSANAAQQSVRKCECQAGLKSWCVVGRGLPTCLAARLP
eukprot:363466-Chlamydomonas_euryale.AAC.2